MPKIIKSIEKAIRILECFIDHEEVSINEIIKLTNLNKSTVYDLMNTLQMNHMVYQNVDNKKYRIGVKLIELGRVYEKQNAMNSTAKHLGELLAAKYKATVHLATYYDDQVVYLNKYESPEVLVSYSKIGKRAPMTCTGLGKAILAFLPKEYKEKYVTNKELPKYNKNSITSKKKLDRELELTKKRGYALDNEELELGIRCIAAPIFSNGEVVGAMSISMLTPYVTEEIIKMVSKEIIQATEKVSNFSSNEFD